MHPSLRTLHQPLIKFIGKRSWPSKPETPHAHPAAPAELKKTFDAFLKRMQSSASSSTSTSNTRKEGGKAFEEYWLAPPRFWRRELQEWEIEAVESGGASLRN